MRIDAHVHYVPPSLAQNLANFAEQEPYWGLLLQPLSSKRAVQGWATAECMLEDMDKAGLDRVILVGEYFQRHENCVARNSQAIEIMKRWPDRVIAFAVIQPKAGQPALAELKRCVEHGLRGVGELNPYAQGYRMDDPDFLRVVEACLGYNLPLNLHINEEVGPYYPGKSATPLRHYYELARRFPELKLILAHWGGGLFFYEIMPRVRRDLQNVWYDTAASPLLYPTKRIFEVALNCIDHHKIFYGSDYPLLLYPRQQSEPGFGLFVDEIKQLGWPDELYDDIMGNNIARLLGLLDEQQVEHPGEGQTAVTPPAKPSAPVISINNSKKDKKIDGFMAVSMVAEVWPETRPVFEKFGIPWQDSTVPFWEPIIQAAGAAGWGPAAQQRLLDELNALI